MVPAAFCALVVILFVVTPLFRIAKYGPIPRLCLLMGSLELLMGHEIWTSDHSFGGQLFAGGLSVCGAAMIIYCLGRAIGAWRDLSDGRVQPDVDPS